MWTNEPLRPAPDAERHGVPGIAVRAWGCPNSGSGTRALSSDAGKLTQRWRVAMASAASSAAPKPSH